MNLLEIAKQELIRSNADHRHPFKLLTLATVDTDHGRPQLRTVVKRNIDSDFKTLIYTDTRTRKVAQIKSNERVSALWYHTKKKLQIRMECKALLIDSDSDLHLLHLSKVKQSKSITDYTTANPPGSPLDSDFVTHTPEIHFTLLQLLPETIEVLQLSREGHQRAMYSLQNGTWAETQLVP